MAATRRIPRGVHVLVVLTALLLLCSSGLAAADSADVDTCNRCHDETRDYPVLSIFQTPHAAVADSRTGFAEQGCGACHGDVQRHLDDENVLPQYTYGGIGDERTPVSEQNEGCLSCHKGDAHLIHWHSSNHEFGDVACVSCHRVHLPHDRVRDGLTQHEVCTDCHRQQDHELRRPSRHPVRDGEMACSDCHQAHGSSSITADLKEPTVNETCYSCHAGKRGPFLWEHLPVREDCTTCHQPHGSVHRGLLEVRSPQLCQQCHLDQVFGDHAARMHDGSQRRSDFVAGRSCLNCHSQVHGSNHPQGYNLRR